MAWSTPLTAASNAALSAAQWNASVRDNLNETAPAKATGANTLFVGAGVNSIAERQWLENVVDTTQTSTSTTYTSLATNGPVLTMTTGTKAVVWINSMQSTNTTGTGAFTTYEVSGATTVVAGDDRAIYHQATANDDVRTSVCSLVSLTAGSNTFRMLYKTTAGTGTWRNRRLQVLSL